MDLFAMLDYSFGRVLTVIISGLYFVYFITLAATTRAYHAMFVRLVAMPQTPWIILLLVFFVLCVYLAKSGAETVGKWSTFLAAGLILTTVGLTLFAIPAMRVDNLLPLVESGSAEIARGGIRFAVMPLGEAVVLLALLGHLDKGASSYKLFFVGAVIATLLLVLGFLRDAAILGARSMDSLLYSSFTAAGVLEVGTIGMRIEFLAALPTILAGITKAAVCLIAAARAMRRVFALPGENAVIVSVAFFSLGLSAALFANVTELFAFPALHFYFAPVFQVGIPVLMWLVAEMKTRRRLKKARVGQ